jgi:hypothetical protein
MLWVIRQTESRGKYQVAILPEHPHADQRGRVYLHRVMVENAIGRLLTSNEVAHHINENPKDNRIENLQLLTKAEHTRLHKTTGVTYVKVKCAQCGKIFDREKRNINGKLVFCSRSHSRLFYPPPQPPRVLPHGSYGAYRKGCRCAGCRSANATRIRNQRNKV